MNLLNSELSWTDRDKWDRCLDLMANFVDDFSTDLAFATEKAHTARQLIDAIDPFIQLNTSAVCPSCEKVCCMNRHGYYDYEDIIFIHLLRLKPPAYLEGIGDTDSCQFISCSGCTVERSIRPNRCNWFFCNALLDHIENGPGRDYREFQNSYQEAIAVRREMLEEFFKALSHSQT